MNKFSFLGVSSRALMIGLVGSVAMPAYAQAQSEDSTAASASVDCEDVNLNNVCDAEEAATGDSIVVTGSRIARPLNLSSPIPVTSVGPEEIASTGNVSLGDTLNQLPQLRATFSQANSTRFIGTSGINALDLRGLGSSRTLTLVNGRRQVTATPGVERVDVNTIPTDLIERVDIVTGGSSAVYGSDAVAGVVNFILKTDFDGIRMRGQAGISSRGDRGSYFTSLTAGKNFADNRGNIAVALEYAKQNTLYFTDRDEQTGAYSGRSQFNATEFTGVIVNPALGPRAAESSLGNGIPDTSFLTGVRNNNISEGGLFTASCPNAAATGESAAAFNARRLAACTGLPNPGVNNALAQFGQTYVFADDGTLIKNPCVTDLRIYGSSNCVGGLGSTLRLTGMLAPGLERKAANLLAHFEVSEAFVPFVEAKFVRIDANQEGQPTFFNNSFSINNPFLTTQARNTLVAALAPGATTFTAQRFNIDFGGRGELHERETYSIVGGVSGTFNSDWKYEIAANYGHLRTYYETQGNIDRAKYANSINAVRNGVGQIVCGINADASTTNDDPSCVPVNLFGNGQVSQAALNYFGVTSSRVQTASLFNITGYVAGDMSQLFELPGGPIAFVLGGEYRRQKSFAAYDDVTKSGQTFLNSILDFTPPTLEVKEVFGEVSIPLLSNMRFAQELTVNAAGRYSDYNIGQTGGVFAWNISGIYAPVRDLRFRASYAKSVRAPTQGDLFSSPSQTFINGFADPCSQTRINDNPNRKANCAAAGVPTTQTFNGTTEPFTNIPASGISANNGGNPNLNEERGRSFTAGAVFEPSAIRGLSLTVDYYDITIKNVIFSLGGQTVINQCYDNPGGINNPFCAAVFRNANGTLAGQSNVVHGGATISLTPTGPSALIAPFNFAKQETSGIDADLGYRFNAGDFKINLRGLLSYVIKRNNYTDVTTPTFYDRQLSELGDPQWQGQLSANIGNGQFNLGYRMRYIGKMTIAGDYETQHSVQGRPPLNPDALPRVWYPQITYHDLRLEFTPADTYKFYVGVDNLFDRLPPLDLLGTAGGDPYNNVGRFFFGGVEFKF